MIKNQSILIVNLVYPYFEVKSLNFGTIRQVVSGGEKGLNEGSNPLMI